MGMEGVLSLIALGVAALAWGSAQAQGKRTQAALAVLKQEQDERFEQWEAQESARAERSVAVPQPRDAPLPATQLPEHIGKMASSVQVLELRALEHDALLCSLVTEDEARHLWNVSQNERMTYELHSGVEGELRSLVRRGLLKKSGDFKIHELPASFELKEHFLLTDSGEMLLALRKHLKSTDIRRQDSLPPRAPESGVKDLAVSSPKVAFTGG